MPNNQYIGRGSGSPAAVSKLGQFRSRHLASVHSAVQMNT